MERRLGGEDGSRVVEAKGAIPHFLKNHRFSIFQLDIIRALVERPKVGRAADTVLVDLRMMLSWQQKNVPPEKSKIIEYADGHIEYKK